IAINEDRLYVARLHTSKGALARALVEEEAHVGEVAIDQLLGLSQLRRIAYVHAVDVEERFVLVIVLGQIPLDAAVVDADGHQPPYTEIQQFAGEPLEFARPLLYFEREVLDHRTVSQLRPVAATTVPTAMSMSLAWPEGAALTVTEHVSVRLPPDVATVQVTVVEPAAKPFNRQVLPSSDGVRDAFVASVWVHAGLPTLSRATAVPVM